jgi:general secretion pathway protein D
MGGLFSATLAFAGGVGVTNNALTAPGTTSAPEPDAKAPPPDAAPAPEDKPAPDEKTAPATPAVAPADEQSFSATNVVVDPATGELKLKMQFHNAPLQSVLTYMSGAAGYIINQRDGGSLSGRVTVWSEQPVNKQEALTLVESMLNQNGYTGLMGPDGRTLTIVKSTEAKHEGIPVILGNVPTNIPIDTKIVTQILPVRSLNAVSLLKDLQPLLPADTTLTANESGNALVMTDTQANIHRIAEIVRALDSVSSSSATIIVFPLKFADAKSVAALIKDLFPTVSASASGGGGSPFGFFSRFSRGGGGDSGGGQQNDTGAGHTPTSRVTAVSDDHANALVVSAPDDLVPTIKELVTSLDTDVQDSTEVKVFSLKNADPIETATLLTTLFPDDSKADDNSNFSSRYRFGFFGGPPPQPSSSTGESDHVKKLNRVLAVPDARTGSLVVTASKDMMPQIITIVDTLDGNPRRKLHVHVANLSFAEPQDVLPVLQDLFPTSTTSRNNNNNNNNAQNSALGTRSQTFNTQQASSTANPFGGAASGPRVGSTGQ